MGNCSGALCYSSEEKSEVLIHNGGEKEVDALTRIKKITSGHYRNHMLVHSALPYVPLLPNTRLEPGKVFYLMPPRLEIEQPCRLDVCLKLAEKEICTREKVKIVVTRQQLELLLRSSKQFKSKGIALRRSDGFKEAYRKWQPALVTIPEVKKY